MYTGVHSDVARTGVHSDVARESYSFDLFDVSLHIPLECKKAGIYGLCIPVDSFDLRRESVTWKFIPLLVCFIGIVIS